MIIGILKEPSFETRTSLLPEHAAVLKKMNLEMLIETGAGDLSFATDQKYSEAGASVGSRSEVLQKSDVVLSINPISDADAAACSGKIII